MTYFITLIKNLTPRTTVAKRKILLMFHVACVEENRFGFRIHQEGSLHIDEDKGIHMRIRSEYVLRKNGARWITEKTT